jgi:hypothetical protein
MPSQRGFLRHSNSRFAGFPLSLIIFGSYEGDLRMRIPCTVAAFAVRAVLARVLGGWPGSLLSFRAAGASRGREKRRTQMLLQRDCFTKNPNHPNGVTLRLASLHASLAQVSRRPGYQSN